MLLDRILGVFKLNVLTFEDIEHDESATGQAVIIVLLVALLSALGSGFAAQIMNTGFVGPFVSTLAWTVAGWLLVSALVYFVGTTFMGGQATLGEMLRVIGFAYAPQLLAIIPCIGGIIGLVWSVAAGFIAVRQGLDLDNGKTVFTIVIAFGVYVTGLIVIGLLQGGASLLF